MDPTYWSVDAAKEFLSDRVNDGMEIFPALDSLMVAIKTVMAFVIGLVQWLCSPVWRILGEHLKNGKDSVAETAKEIIEDYAVKTKEMSEQIMNAGAEIKEKAAETVKDYSEQAKDTGNQALDSAMEFGSNYFNAGTSFFRENDDDFLNSVSVTTISVTILGIVMAGAIITFLSGWYQGKASDEDKKEDIEDSDD